MILAGLLGFWLYSSSQPDSENYKQFHLGLDLSGGSHLVYEADVSDLDQAEIQGSMESLREVIERRVNAIGVSEPLVQVEQSGFGEDASHRLIIELPGVTDIDEAIAIIKETPLLEFRTERADFDQQAVNEELERIQEGITSGQTEEEVQPNEELFNPDQIYEPTELTGRYLERATLEFAGGGTQGPGLSEPVVSLEFNNEGSDIFAELTRDNLGKTIAIFLDGELISAPVVQAVITGGQAQISGSFEIDEARELARNLNLGALPVPIELVATQTVGPTLGARVLADGINAGIIGLILVALFMVLWYRLPGLVAVLSLSLYVMVMLSLFKLIPVTLTAAGIAGFILSIGLAVDANVLIFERLKEELEKGDSLEEAIKDGFSRAWLSIRDSNLSSIISAIILFWFGTSLIQGFALTFGLGVLISMLTAISVTRTWLLALRVRKKTGAIRFLFNSGLRK